MAFELRVKIDKKKQRYARITHKKAIKHTKLHQKAIKQPQKAIIIHPYRGKSW